MSKGSKRRPGKGYDVNYDKIFKKPLTDRDRFYDGLPPSHSKSIKDKDNTKR